MSNYQQPYQNTKEINLKEYVDVIRRRLWIIVLVATLTTATGYLYSYYSSLNNTSLYQTSTRMILGAGTEDMSTLMVMITDPIIMESVKAELELTRTSDSIASQIEVTRIDESQVVQISVIDQDVKIAAGIANSTAASFKEEINNILGFTDVQLLSEAKENPSPINETQGNRNSLIGLGIGLILGIGLVFLLDSIDMKVRDEREVEEILGVPVIGVIANMNKKKLATNKTSSSKEKSERGVKVDGKENVYNQQQ